MEHGSDQSAASSNKHDTATEEDRGASGEFKDLVCGHIPALRVYARALSRNVADADDLVQDCLLKAIEKSHLWRRGSNLKAWLFTILRNLFINGYRRTRSRPVRVPFDDHYEETLGHDLLKDKPATMHQIVRALNGLPEEQREVVVLIIMEGLSYDEAAAIAAVPLGTVRSRLSRARASLRSFLGEQEFAELAPNSKSFYRAA